MSSTSKISRVRSKMRCVHYEVRSEWFRNTRYLPNFLHLQNSYFQIYKTVLFITKSQLLLRLAMSKAFCS